MSPEAQRIAIAEACGWVREYTNVQTWNAGLNSSEGGYEPIRTMLFRRKGKCFSAENLPDYLNDLNAMHDAEMSQVDMEDGHFIVLFREYLHTNLGHDCSLAIHATAAERAEAFLRTLGKWGEAA